jgi:hypothetical protein
VALLRSSGGRIRTYDLWVMRSMGPVPWRSPDPTVPCSSGLGCPRRPSSSGPVPARLARSLLPSALRMRACLWVPAVDDCPLTDATQPRCTPRSNATRRSLRWDSAPHRDPFKGSRDATPAPPLTSAGDATDCPALPAPCSAAHTHSRSADDRSRAIATCCVLPRSGPPDQAGQAERR